MNDFPECEAFTGRRRAICRCEVLTLDKCNAYRERWGLPPLEKRTLRATVQLGQLLEQAKPIDPASNAQILRGVSSLPELKSGPGTELKEIFDSLGVKAVGCGGCHATLQEMNKLGLDGCRAKKQELVLLIKSRAISVKLNEKLKAAGAAFFSGLAFKINWTDPIPGLYDEALRRWEAKIKTH